MVHGNKNENDEVLFRALAEAVVRVWSKLPQEVQHHVFDAAVSSRGEAIKHDLAVFLHDKHQRTLETAKNNAVPEPDSLGG